MAIALANTLVALFLGFGAVQELIVRGIRGGEVQPFIVGLAGIVVSLLLLVSGFAAWQGWASARRLLLWAAGSTILFHIYAALPPHRNVGFLALLVGAGYGLILLAITFVGRGKRPQTA